MDVFVEDLVICELKAVDEVNPVWEAQILSHLKLTDKRLGFLINFNVSLIKNGIIPEGISLRKGLFYNFWVLGAI